MGERNQCSFWNGLDFRAKGAARPTLAAQEWQIPNGRSKSFTPTFRDRRFKGVIEVSHNRTSRARTPLALYKVAGA